MSDLYSFLRWIAGNDVDQLSAYSWTCRVFEWLLAEARFWAKQWSTEAINHGGGLDWWAGLLPWETPEANGITAEDMA